LRRPRPRQVVAPAHRGRGRAGLRLAWTDAQHERGPKSWGGQKAWEPVARRLAPEQTMVTAVLAHRERLEGLEGVVQPPDGHAEAGAYGQATGQDSSAPMEAARGRVWALLPPLLPRLGSKKRTEMAREMVPPLAQEGPVPQAHSAFDHGVLTLERTRGLERVGTPWGSEGEGARPIQGQGQGRRGDAGAAELRREPPERFRPVRVRGRPGNLRQRGALTKGVRVKRTGRKRLGMVHAHEDLREAPRLLRTDARHGESGRVLETWS
jgi:hypothetical protein